MNATDEPLVLRAQLYVLEKRVVEQQDAIERHIRHRNAALAEAQVYQRQMAKLWMETGK